MMKYTALILLALGSTSAFAPTRPLAQPVTSSSSSSLSVLPDSLNLPGAAVDVAQATSSAASTMDAASSSAGGPPLALLVAGAVGVLAVIALAFSGAGAVLEAPSKGSTQVEKEVEPEEPIDLSIPYDAAAMLTYCQYKGVTSIEDAADFKAFKALYEEATVAEVTLKKMQRDMAAMEANVAAKQKALEATTIKEESS